MRLLLTGPQPADVAMTQYAPELGPDDGGAWMAARLGAAPTSRQETETALGWPFTLAHAAVRDAAGAIVEHRVGAFYRFFHFAAAAVVVLPDYAALTARLPALVALWQTGRPDFRTDGVVALAELWGDTSRRRLH